MSSKDAPVKGGSGSRRHKLSREAALLTQSNVNWGNVHNSSPGPWAEGKTGAGAAPSAVLSPPKRKNAGSAPPALGSGDKHGHWENFNGLSADPVAANGKAKKKRTASAAAAAGTDGLPADEQWPKKVKSPDGQQQQVPRVGSGSGGEADASCSLRRGAQPADPITSEVAPGAGRDADLGTLPAGSKRNGKAQRASADQRAMGGSIQTDGTRAADSGAADQATDNSGPSRKSRGGADQAAAAVLDSGVHANAAAGAAQGAGQPRVASQPTEKAPKRQGAANPVGNPAAALAIPPADAARPPTAVAAPSGPEAVRGRQDGTAAAPPGPEARGGRQEGAAGASPAPEARRGRQEAAAAASPVPEARGGRPEGATADRQQPPPSSAAAGFAGAGPSNSAQEPGRDHAPGAPQQTAPAAGGSAAYGNQYPATGTTPVKPFVPINVERMDEIGRRQRRAVIDLQRQLADMRALYEDLKATKIQDLERVLAQQEELTAEQVREAEDCANHWKAVAHEAEERARAAGSQEIKVQIRNLQIQIEELLQQNSDLLFQKAALMRELALSQQACHDARAKLAYYEAAEQARAGGAGADSKGQTVDIEQRASEVPDAGMEEAVGQGAGGDQQPGGGAAASEEPSPVVTLGGDLGLGAAAASVGGGGGGTSGIRQSPSREVSLGLSDMVASTGSGGSGARKSLGRGLGLQFPTLSPGVGIQFPSPNNNLQPQDSPGVVPDSNKASGHHGVRTLCQNAINMLPHLCTPAPSIPTELGSAGIPPTSQAGVTLSGGRGISTECLRVVMNLPHLRVSSPDVESRLATGPPNPLAAHVDTTLLARGPSDGVTPVAGNGAEGQLGAQSANGNRRSTGSPIDGIFQQADLSHAHGLGAPEGFRLVAQPQQGQYTFVDLNPASALKEARPGAAAAATAAAPNWPGAGVRAQPVGGGGGDMAALMATAAAMPLPPSPAPSLQGAATHGNASVTGRILPNAGIVGTVPPARKSVAVQNLPVQVAPRPCPQGVVSPDAAAVAAVQSGGSVQDSCTLSTLALRAMMQQLEATRRLDQEQAQASAGNPVAVAQAHRAATDDTGKAAAQVAGGRNVPQEAPMPQGAGEPDVPQEALKLRGAAPSRGASPLTATNNFWEEVLGWKMQLLPNQEFRMTHKATGMSFSLREVEMDDDDVAERMAGQGPAAERYFEYTPLDLGTVEGHMPDPFTDSFEIMDSQRGELLDRLEKAVVAAAAAAKEAVAKLNAR